MTKYQYLIENYALNENIPRDLLQAYKNSNMYGSSRYTTLSPDEFSTYSNEEKKSRNTTKHRELRDPERRTVNWDYGKAKYKEISKEYLLNHSDEFKAHPENYRFIINGNLVEYELRPNGQYYAIYGDSNTPVSFTTTNKQGQEEQKNYTSIRFVPMMSAVKLADKIYWTDEYDHPYTDEMRRNQIGGDRRTYFTYYKNRLPSDDPDYEIHHPAAIFKGKNFTSHQDIPDTGFHGDRGVKHPFLGYAKRAKEQAFNNFDHLRNALKNFEDQREFYDEAEFAEKYEKLKERKDQAYNNYIQKCDAYKKAQDKYKVQVNQELVAFQKTILDYLENVEKYTSNIYQASQQLKKLTTQTATSEDGCNIQKSRDSLAAYAGKLQHIIVGLKELNNDAEELRNNPEIIKDTETFNDKLQGLQKQLNQRIEYINNCIAKYKYVIDSNQKLLDQIQPNTAAKRKARAEKAGVAKLDPGLTDIVQFA